MVDGRFCTLRLREMKFQVPPSGLGSRPVRIDQSMEFGDQILTLLLWFFYFGCNMFLPSR